MKSLVICNEKGGVGKSMIATQFAYFCAIRRKLRVLVLDLDHQGNTSKSLLKQKKDYFFAANINAGQILRGETLTINEDQKNLVIVGDESLLNLQDMVTNPEDDINQMIYNNLYNAFESFRSYFDLLIIDTNPNPDIRMKAAMYLSNYAISPIQCNSESIDGIELLIKLIDDARQMNSEFEYLGLLVNLMENKAYQKQNLMTLIDKHEELMLSDKKKGVYPNISNNIAFQVAQDCGVPVWSIRQSTAQRAWAMLQPVFSLIAEKMSLPDLSKTKTNEEQK